ncbi:MAG: hypothetical protein U0N22_12390 [Acutalibacter sp.]|jgi:hypothetical protein
MPLFLKAPPAARGNQNAKEKDTQAQNLDVLFIVCKNLLKKDACCEDAFPVCYRPERKPIALTGACGFRSWFSFTAAPSDQGRGALLHTSQTF